jgi:phage gp29-like protein
MSSALENAARLRRIRSTGQPLVASHGLNLQRSNTSLLPLIAQKGEASTDQLRVIDEIQDINPSLAPILRPQSLGWRMLPYLAAVTPTYVEGVLRGALSGNHVQSCDLFDLMMDSDPEIAACVQEYIEGVLRKKFSFEPYHEEDEEPTDEAVEKCKVVSAALRNMRPDVAADENDLRGTVRDIISARFYGQSLLEVEWHDKDNPQQVNLRNISNFGEVVCPRSTFWVHPTCYGWDTSIRLGLRTELTDIKKMTKVAKNKRGNSLADTTSNYWMTGTSAQPLASTLTDLPRNQFLLGVHKFRAGSVMSGSVLRSLAMWWVFTNFCGDWLLNYAQLFGIPFRKATYEPGTPENIKSEIKQMLQNMGSAGYALLPKGAELEFDKGGGGASDSPQAFLLNYGNEMKRRVILHQTMTGGAGSAGNGAGKGGMDSESAVKSDCIDEGARFAEGVLNLQLVPMILEMNYGEGGDSEAPMVKLVDDTIGNLADAQKIQILSTFMDIPDSYTHKLFNIPKAKPDDVLIGQEAGTLGVAAELQKQQPGQPGGQQQPNAEEEEGAVQSSRAALSPVNIKRVTLALEATAAKAFADTVGPLVKRLKAIDEITDVEAKEAALSKFLRDIPSIKAALVKDPSLANSTMSEAIKSFLMGTKSSK